jgi:hypothetical protein
MKRYRTALISTTSLLLMAGIAMAQSTGTPVGSGSGTSGGVPGGPASGPGSQLDLPMEPSRLGDSGAITPDDDDGDDPSDTDPPVIYGEEIDSENDTIVYVIDQSCSMGWDVQTYTTPDGGTASGPRIDRAKAELTRSILGLSDTFRFNVISYDCGTRLWSSAMQDANDANKQSAVAWVNSLQPGGATGTGPATAAGLAERENMAVVLLTDGAPNCGATGASGHRAMIRSANTQGATINVFGIAASGSYRAFCQGVASDSGGSYYDVP